MMRHFVRLLFLFALASPVSAETQGAQSRLESAHAAYDRGDFNQAQVLYEESIRDHGASAELFYNAGNAAFRRDYTGQAMLLYRRAWCLNPRDADVRANMELARQRTGAILPSPGILQRAARELSQREWTLLFKGSFWIAVGLTAVSILFPMLRRFTGAPAGVAAAVALIALSGWMHWRQWQNQPEVVVIRAGEKARYEPRPQATAHFEAPEGSILIREETFDQWVKVRDGIRAGWLPADSVERVYPWHTGGN